MIHKAKKSLGQNFLKSEIALKKIVEAGEIKREGTILEIGPGKGALTKKLLERAGKVIAIEKDNELFAFLQQKFIHEISEGQLILIQGDILELEIAKLKIENYKIIANIPYNITGAILKKFLTGAHQPEAMVLLVQHEVAQRILARDGKESILSISVKAYGTPKMIDKVDKRYFSPQPKVNSAIIKISDISRELFDKNKVDEDKFWEIVKKGFAHKRKKLSSNLKSLGDKDEKALPERNKILQTLGNKRAEDLSLPEWVKAVQNLCKT